jgi:hypothetical protein
VRAEEDRLALRGRLEQVLPSPRDEAAADEDERREPVGGGELADRVEDGDRRRAGDRPSEAARARMRPARSR